MSIYNEVLDAVRNGKKFRVNLKEKSLKVDGKFIIERGEYDNEKELIHIGDCTLSAITMLEDLYEQYRTSVPSSTVLGSQSYFKALEVDELTDYDLVNNIGRNEAQASLELYILCNREQLFKEMFEGNSKWFWQGKDKSLIVLREWLV